MRVSNNPCIKIIIDVHSLTVNSKEELIELIIKERGEKTK